MYTSLKGKIPIAPQGNKLCPKKCYNIDLIANARPADAVAAVVALVLGAGGVATFVESDWTVQKFLADGENAFTTGEPP